MSTENELEFLNTFFDRLFPLCRSITGPGLRNSLDIFGEKVPFVRHSVQSGSRAFDWTVPDEWSIRGASLIGPDGRQYSDFNRTNLSVVNYSAPIDVRISLAELQPHLHSIPGLPTAVPYVTSYYKRTWGFCLPDQVRSQMPEGEYHAVIDSTLCKGSLDFADVELSGESPNLVLLTSYLCHPSMANNELSGPLVLALLYSRISRWSRRRLSYRFVLAPETIGSLVYLSTHGEELKKRVVGGMVLTCLGGPSQTLSYKTSRRENALIDRLVQSSSFSNAERGIRIRMFTPVGGSDERQFCSPGFNLPMGQISRNVYGEYDGYHNSLDTKEFMDIRQLVRSVDQIENVLRDFEIAGRFVNLSPHGEPQLGRRDLYPNLNSQATWSFSSDEKFDSREFLRCLLMVLNYSDGQTDMLDIAGRCGVPLSDLEPVIACLEREGLLRYKSEYTA